MRKIKNKKGMTLIEVIIAMAIFSIFVIIIITVYTSVITAVGRTRQQVIVNYESQIELEKAISEVEIIVGDTNTMIFNFDLDIINMGPISVTGKIVENGKFKVFVPDLPAEE